MINSDQDWLEEIFKKRPGSIKPGLERIREAYQILGSPLASSKVVLVGGTNGKGSTGGMLAALLSNSGTKVAHYTSPHISCFSERIRVFGENYSLQELKNLYNEMVAALDKSIFDQLSFFEITTLLAFILFEKAEAQVCIIEVGLGGRLDATNILEPDLSIITSIGLDHTDWLGNKLTDIAFEKGGISRKDRPLLIGAGAIGDPSVHQYYLDLQGPQKFFYKDGFSAENEHFYLGDESYAYPDWLPNRSKVMLENFSLASKAYQLVQGDGFESGSLDAAIRSDLEFFPSSFLGRGQVVSLEESAFYLDVAHNPASLHGSISHFKETQGGGADCVAVLSLLADKDVSGILKLVNKYFAHVILFKSNSDRGASREDCEKHLPHDHKMSWADSIDEAVTEARQLILREDVGDNGRNRIFFGGSFAAVAEFFGKYPETFK